MHEIGILSAVIETVRGVVAENGLKHVEAIVLELGELSPALPDFLEVCYPAVVDETEFRDTKLEINIVPANAVCLKCNEVFNVVANDGICPKCGQKVYDVLGGTELTIKEIRAC